MSEAYLDISIFCKKESAGVILPGVIAGVENSLRDFEKAGSIFGFEQLERDNTVVFSVRGLRPSLDGVYERLRGQFGNRMYRYIWGKAGVSVSVAKPKLL